MNVECLYINTRASISNIIRRPTVNYSETDYCSRLGRKIYIYFTTDRRDISSAIVYCEPVHLQPVQTNYTNNCSRDLFSFSFTVFFFFSFFHFGYGRGVGKQKSPGTFYTAATDGKFGKYWILDAKFDLYSESDY